MKNKLKNAKKNTEGVFLELIIIIILAIFLLSYFHISISEVVNWFTVSIHNIFK